MAALTIRFHGVRGSVPCSSSQTAGIGGNTSCVEVMAGGQRIVFDAGSGLRNLGYELVKAGTSNTVILLSHLHWDHIQGLPFFTPLYVPGNRIEVMGGPNAHMSLQAALARQMSPPFFPVSMSEVAADLRFRDLKASDQVELGEVRITMAKLNHPDPVYGYRIDFAGRSVVYATDTEHYSCVDPALVKLAKGADLLIHDAQYTPEEYSGEVGPCKAGWGHSTFEAAAQLANCAGVGQLLLFHHDPTRDDRGVEDIERRTRQLFPMARAAREGMVVKLQDMRTAQERLAA